jgi:DivIVA domain-containing protein
MTTAENAPARDSRRLTPADVQSVTFAHGSVLHPGYAPVEVDRFLNRLGDELARLTAEKAELRDQVHALQQQLEGMAPPVAPSDQAVRILSTAQQTADRYVAEAEDFSRQMTSDARAQYEEQLRQARENAGAIIQAAQEAAARVSGGGPRTPDSPPPSSAQLEEQVAYLKAFGQACRVQLRSYLEALLRDVETEWGRADPGALPPAPLRIPAQRPDPDPRDGGPATFHANTTTATPPDNGSTENRSATATQQHTA